MQKQLKNRLLKDINYESYLCWIESDILEEAELEELNSILYNYNDLCDATVQKPEDSSFDTMSAVRSTKIKFLDWEEKRLEYFYDKIVNCINTVNKENYNFNLTYIEPMQYGVYTDTDQGHYDWHIDHINVNGALNNIRKLSFTYLLDSPEKDYNGGEFQIRTNNQDQTIDIKKNMIVFFPSNVLHRVKPVLSGTRRSIVGWVNGPNWV